MSFSQHCSCRRSARAGRGLTIGGGVGLWLSRRGLYVRDEECGRIYSYPRNELLALGDLKLGEQQNETGV